MKDAVAEPVNVDKRLLALLRLQPEGWQSELLKSRERMRGKLAAVDEYARGTKDWQRQHPRTEDKVLPTCAQRSRPRNRQFRSGAS